jgi:hypothetical protein
MFDFSAHTVERLIELGYADTRATIGEAEALVEEMMEMRRRGDRNVALAAALPPRRRK